MFLINTRVRYKHSLFPSFNPLNQVYVFNDRGIITLRKSDFRFNPLNQVYVFNYEKLCIYTLQQSFLRFNPLNQVYVFNPFMMYVAIWKYYFSFNPLNQVYVFNH